MDLRRLIRGLGKTLIAFGVLLFLFVGYQLWGTGLTEQRQQKALRATFEKQLLTTPPTLPLPAGSTSAEPPPPAPELGGAMGLLEIPKIDVKKFVIEGVGVEDLKGGPGHYPETPMPGERGNSAIAGHRTTYGAPFYNLDALEPGDPIFVSTTGGRFRYDVMETLIVDPSESSVLDPTPDDRLTLTTCHPRFSAAQRMIVIAKLMSAPVERRAEPPPDAAADPAPGTTAADPAPGTTTAERPAPEPRTELTAGLSGAEASKRPAILWGALAAAIWLGGWVLGRLWRRWPAYLIAAPAFFVVLFVFYENVARLLPANV